MKVHMVCKASVVSVLRTATPSAFYIVESVHQDRKDAAKIARRKNKAGKGGWHWSVRTRTVEYSTL